MLVLRRQRAVEKLVPVAFDEEGRKALHLALPNLLGVVFDVEPVKLGARKLPGERVETIAVFAARVAPRGAEASYLHSTNSSQG